jgi:hypothetical protein
MIASGETRRSRSRRFVAGISRLGFGLSLGSVDLIGSCDDGKCLFHKESSDGSGTRGATRRDHGLTTVDTTRGAWFSGQGQPFSS